eukprot:CAMPEP_0168425326 /NCGR_PEP_ID=MMETSP0228-20121227/35268_1 /TAXON_ID=133427 /ORGANISM="Protoceratium reticulatum, Strain CCCM 535 (=CCMP 1889)" /LENGTH=41 /DNA_ID= /DNA_START= /DNA_END= /DNA_ORIENTATION=
MEAARHASLSSGAPSCVAALSTSIPTGPFGCSSGGTAAVLG